MRLFWSFLISKDLKSLVVRQLVGQLVYTMFINNNDVSFYLRLKGNLLKHQRLSKSHDHDYMQAFLLLFMPLLTPPIVEKSHILAGIYFIFLQERPRPGSRVFQCQDWRGSYQVRQILAFFCNLVNLILG